VHRAVKIKELITISQLNFKFNTVCIV